LSFEASLVDLIIVCFIATPSSFDWGCDWGLDWNGISLWCLDRVSGWKRRIQASLR